MLFIDVVFFLDWDMFLVKVGVLGKGMVIVLLFS